MAKNEAKKCRLRLYCEPRLELFLKESWLSMGFWDGIFYFPSVLSQLGISGVVTAYGDDDCKTITFVTPSREETILKFFKKEDEENSCAIPGFNKRFNSDFAVYHEDDTGCKSLFFYEIGEYDWGVCPRFSKQIRKGGLVYTELSEGEDVKVTFKVNKNNYSVVLTVVIKNDDRTKAVIEARTDNILNVLNTENAKAVYKIYTEVKKYIGHITNNFIISCIREGTPTDELVVTDGETQKFMLSYKMNTITCFKTGVWELQSPNLSLRNNNNQIDFSGTVDYLFLSESKSVKEVVMETENFIKENMKFAFFMS